MARRGAPGGLSATSYAVLGLLWKVPDPLSAVEIRTRANFSLRFFYWAPAVSHIRKELARLESLRLVTAEEVRLGRVKTTLVHQITPQGEEVLREWATSLPDDEPVVLKHPVLLRIWLGDVIDPARLVEILDQHVARTEQTIDQLQWGQRRAREEHLDELPEARYRRAVGAYVLRSCYAELANVRQLRDEIADPGTEVRPPSAGPPPLRSRAGHAGSRSGLDTPSPEPGDGLT